MDIAVVPSRVSAVIETYLKWREERYLSLSNNIFLAAVCAVLVIAAAGIGAIGKMTTTYGTCTVDVVDFDSPPKPPLPIPPPSADTTPIPCPSSLRGTNLAVLGVMLGLVVFLTAACAWFVLHVRQLIQNALDESHRQTIEAFEPLTTKTSGDGRTTISL